MSNKQSQFTMTISATDRASSAFRQVGQSSKALQQELGGLDKVLAGLGGALGGGELFAAAGGVLGGISAGASLQEFGNFEKALWETTKVTDEATAEIKKKMMEIPAELGSATELTTGYYQVISAGITDVAKAQDMLLVASQTAKAAGVTQAEAINALAKVMNAYGDEIKDATAASNMFFTIEKLGMTNVRELAPLMGELSTVAKSLGVEYNELAGSMSLVTQTSGTASQASTQLRSLMLELQKPAKNLQMAFDAVGIKSFKSLVETQGWPAALRKLQEGAEKSGQALAEAFGSQESFLGFNALMKKNFDILQGYSDEVKKTDDALNNAFSGYTKIREAQYTTLQSNFTNLSIRAGESFRGIESSGLDALNAGLGTLGENFDTAANGAIIFGTALTTLIATKKLAGLQLTTLGAQYTTFGGVAMQTSTAMGRMATLARGAGASLLTAFGGPVGLAVTALGGGIAYLATRESEAERAARLLAEAQKEVQKSLDASTEATKKRNTELGEAAKLYRENAEKKAVEAIAAQWKTLDKELSTIIVTNQDWLQVGKEDIAQNKEKAAQMRLYADTIEILKVQLQDGAITGKQFEDAIALFIKQLATGDQTAKEFGLGLEQMFSDGFFTKITAATEAFFTLAKATHAASPEFMGPPEPSPNDQKPPKTTTPMGSKVSDEAKRKAEETKAALESLNDEIAKLTMTDAQYREFALGNKLDELREKLPHNIALIQEFEAAQRKAWLKEDTETSNKHLDTQISFYEELMDRGGEYAGLIDLQTAAIEKQAEAWRTAGIPQNYIDQMVHLQQLEISTDWMSGLERGFLKLGRDAEDMASIMESAVTQSASSMSSALANFVLEGKGDFTDLANSILNDLARMAIEMAANYAIQTLFKGIGGAFNNFFNGGTSNVASTVGGIASNITSVFAQGGVAAHGIAGYSNTIVASPTLFPMTKAGITPFAQGAGLMGEAGPEAIMPLSRDARGRLGVNAVGGYGGGVIINVNPTVVDRTQKGVAVTSEQSTDSMGNMKLTFLIDEIDSALAGKVTSGRSSLGNSLQKSYGLSRSGQAFRK